MKRDVRDTAAARLRPTKAFFFSSEKCFLDERRRRRDQNDFVVLLEGRIQEDLFCAASMRCSYDMRRNEVPYRQEAANFSTRVVLPPAKIISS